MAVGINDDFDKPLSFALLDGARHLAHWPPANQDAPSRLPRLGLRQTGTAERRINIKRIGGKPVADAAAIAVEEIGRDDLEVIIGSMGEGTLTIAVAERPDTGHTGAQLIVGHNKSALVDFDTSLVEAKIVGIRSPSNRQQRMGANDLSIARLRNQP